MKDKQKLILGVKEEGIWQKPKSKTNTKVRYFDPSVAPLVTSEAYNEVENVSK